MGALQFVQVPGYHAILFRRTIEDHKLPEGLIPRSKEWLGNTDAEWNGSTHEWTFPSNATVTFGYMKHEDHKYRYQSAAFQYIGWDELTQFLKSQYTYMFSRLRRLQAFPVPLHVRGASNPGNVGHDWVKRRFMVETAPGSGIFVSRPPRLFIPARIEDNPYLDRATYEANLAHLDPITRRQLMNGDWTARHGGNKFLREWFKIVKAAPAAGKRVRYWDMAATTPEPGKDPDWTAGCRMSTCEGRFYIEHMVRRRESPAETEKLILSTSVTDRAFCQQRNVDYEIWMEQEPGSQSEIAIDYYRRKVLPGFNFRPNKVTGSKELRANPFSSAVEAGNVFLVEGHWIDDFLDEVEGFPLGEHDDQVDCASGAFEKLNQIEPWVKIDTGW